VKMTYNPLFSSRAKSRRFSEQDIADYSTKKAQKKAIRVAKRLKAQTIFGYSNDSNSFGVTIFAKLIGIEEVGEGLIPDKGKLVAGSRLRGTEDAWQSGVGGWHPGSRRV
ncbi:hypothetical protein GIB67_007838, partial [Kingdonia uniflora]